MVVFNSCPATRSPSTFLRKRQLRRLEHVPWKLRSNPVVFPSTIMAIFWGPKKVSKPQELNPSLGSFPLIASVPEGSSAIQMKPQKISLSVVTSISEISAEEDWDACALDATGPEKFNPFLSHTFLSSLEESGSATKQTGWLPQHILAQDEFKKTAGVVPLYVKSHSYGEYVFNHSWADAFYRYGSRYYPKLQSCVPFTPVTGQRILVRNTWFKEQVFDILLSALKDMPAKNEEFRVLAEDRSAVPLDKSELSKVSLSDTLPISHMHSYSFDEFLMDMKQSKRKTIRQERKKISAQNLKMTRLRGDEIKAKHWDSFYKFYRNTTENKWGSAYLTRDFFQIMGSKMADNVLLVVAEDDGELNLLGGDSLFGRLWGCRSHVYYPNLHFEACYYQDIEAAIELKLSKVEAGPQELKGSIRFNEVTNLWQHTVATTYYMMVLEKSLKIFLRMRPSRSSKS